MYDCFNQIFDLVDIGLDNVFKLISINGDIVDTKQKLNFILFVFFILLLLIKFNLFFIIGLEGIEPSFSNWKSDVLTVRR